MLVGFGGCKLRILRKYLRPYASEDVALVVPETQWVLFSTARYTAFARLMLDVLKHEGWEDRPVVVHGLCNPVSIAVSVGLSLAKRRPETYGFFRERLTGVVFDSAPGVVLPTCGLQVWSAFREALTGK